MCREHFWLFWYWYFPHYHKKRIPAFKRPIFRAFKEAYRLVDVEPRDHGKSAAASCGAPLWIGLCNPFKREVERVRGGGFRYALGDEETIAQISHAGNLARMWVRRHRRELEYNRRLIADWGYQVTANQPDGIWTQDELLLANGAHIYSKGAGEQIRGDHPTVIIVDDLEGKRQSYSKDQRDKLKEYFWADLYGALEADSRLWVIGTLLHRESLLSDLLLTEIKTASGQIEQWAKFKFSALLPDGEPLAPELWPKDRIEALRAVLLIHRPSVWWSEYMNEPQAGTSPIFPSAWFEKEHNGFSLKDDEFREKLPNLRKVTFVDPNAGDEEQNDYSAIVTLGYKLAEEPEIYVLECKAFRGTLRHKVNQAVESWERWRGRIGFEGIAFQTWIKQVFEEVCSQKFYHPDVYQTSYKDRPIKGEEMPKRLDKVARAELVQVFFEHNWIKFDYADEGTKSLLEELKVFPTGEHDDRVDAIVGALWEIKDQWNNWKASQNRRAEQPRYDPESGIPL